MTDRAQPGAIDSIVRNDELAQALGQFSDGWIVPGDDPTPAAQRREDVDDEALDGFDLSHSPTSLEVTVEPGEAFVDGQSFTATVFLDSTEGNGASYFEAALVAETDSGDIPINRVVFDDPEGRLDPKTNDATATIEIEITQQDG